MAGTVAQDLWDRCLPLSRMSERKNVHGGVPASSPMPQPLTVEINPMNHKTPNTPASCEKTILFRHGPLLPKITHPRSSHSSTVLFVEILNPVTNPYRYKRPNKTLVHLLIDRKNKEDLIESP